MVADKHPFGLISDQLVQVIKDYVATQIPSSETLDGEIMHIPFISISRLPKALLAGPVKTGKGQDIIVSVTDKYLRLHFLDTDIGLSRMGYRFYERALEEGRISRSSYETQLDKRGARVFHIPNQIGSIHISLEEISEVGVQVLRAFCADIIWQNYQEQVSHVVQIDVTTKFRLIEMTSFFIGATDLYERLVKSLLLQDED